MVPHKVTGMSLLSTLYGCEALLPEKIEHTRYDSDEDYEKAVAGHRGDAGHLRASIEKLLPLFRCSGILQLEVCLGNCPVLVGHGKCCSDERETAA